MRRAHLLAICASGLGAAMAVGSWAGDAAAQARPEAPKTVAPSPATAATAAPGDAAPAKEGAPAAKDAAKAAGQEAPKDAAAPGAAPAPGAPGGATVKVERTASGAKLFRITDGMLVEGQMQKPNAFYVLQRATIDYDFEALSESFLPRIRAATKKPPF